MNLYDFLQEDQLSNAHFPVLHKLPESTANCYSYGVTRGCNGLIRITRHLSKVGQGKVEWLKDYGCVLHVQSFSDHSHSSAYVETNL